MPYVWEANFVSVEFKISWTICLTGLMQARLMLYLRESKPNNGCNYIFVLNGITNLFNLKVSLKNVLNGYTFKLCQLVWLTIDIHKTSSWHVQSGSLMVIQWNYGAQNMEVLDKFMSKHFRLVPAASLYDAFWTQVVAYSAIYWLHWADSHPLRFTSCRCFSIAHTYASRRTRTRAHTHAHAESLLPNKGCWVGSLEILQTLLVL